MNPRILIVEDEEALTLLLRYNLEAAGYDIESVARGDDADLRLREAIPDERPKGDTLAALVGER